MKTLRCAIYTRKSSEEGLEQGFNSLHAQREACEAYVLSQAGEGWKANPTIYDDGGYSGGSMERPGLKQLLADIERKAVDVVVVYKVDRLTRSLADFARIVELFDKHQVSFVSVTQAFNTTTSMGRLTLNVLLSFAQFEREVTGERIRDKVAASKAKGLWMGGRTPIGYDVADHRLVINETEAETVRVIFNRYLELGSVRQLRDDLARNRIRSKIQVTRSGRKLGGGVFERGALYHLLSNPVYRGAIRHKQKLYEDAHPAIVDSEVWASVQAKLNDNSSDRSTLPKTVSPTLLAGLLFDDRGNAMVLSHTNKNGRRYRYYVSSAMQRDDGVLAGSLPRISADVIEKFIAEQVTPMLWHGWELTKGTDDRLRQSIVRIGIGQDRIVVIVRSGALVADHLSPDQGTAEETELRFAIRLKHRQGAYLIEVPDQIRPAHKMDRALSRAVCFATEATRSLGELTETVAEVGDRFGYTRFYAAKLLPLAWLAPDLVEKIFEGRQPSAISLGALLASDVPHDWTEQRAWLHRIGLVGNP